MRIGLFTETYPPQINGVSTSLTMLKKALEEEGHTVYLVTSNPNSALKYDWDEENKILKVPGIKTGIYDYRLSAVYPARVITKIKKWNLDIIHSHHEFGIGNMAVILSKEFNIPLVHTLHTMYEDNLYYITRGHFQKFSKGVLKRFLKFYCVKECEELVVPTEKVYNWLKYDYKFKKDISIIPSGIDTSRFYRNNLDKETITSLKKHYKIKDKDYILLAVGRVAPEKSLDYLIKRMPDIVKKQSNIKLMIVGDGPELNKLKDLTISKKVEKNVLFTGKVTWDDMPYYYALGDLLVSSSTYETQGLTVVEAMASGIIPICIDDPAFKTMINTGINGLLFKTKEEYIEDVLKVYEDKNLRDNLKKNAKRRAEDFNAENYAKKLIEVYERAIKNSSTKGLIRKITKIIKGDKKDDYSVE